MNDTSNRILGRVLAIEEMTGVSGAQRAEGDGRPLPSVTKWFLDTNRFIDNIDVPDVPVQQMATKPFLDTNPITDYQGP